VYGAVVEVHSVQQQVMGLTLQSCKFFSFSDFLDNINRGEYFKATAKMSVLVNWLIEAVSVKAR